MYQGGENWVTLRNLPKLACLQRELQMPPDAKHYSTEQTQHTHVQSDSISNIHLDKLGPYTGIFSTN